MKSRRRATKKGLPLGANKDDAWVRLVIPNFIRLLMAGDQPWLIGDDVIISALQNVWDHVYGNKIPFTIGKNTVPFNLVSLLFVSIFSFICFSRQYKSSMTIEANSVKRLFVLCANIFGSTARVRMIGRWMSVSLQSLRMSCWRTATCLYSREWKIPNE